MDNFNTIKKSLEKPEYLQKDTFIGKEKLVRTNGLISVEEPNVLYRLYNDEIFKSFNVPAVEFTNYLAENIEIDPYIEKGIEELCNREINPKELEIIKDSGKYRTRIRAVLKEYDSNGKVEGYLEEGLLYKIKVTNLLGKSGKFRVIFFYDINEKGHYLDLIFMDFYHLFIPSEDNGKSWRDVSHNEYRKRRKLNHHVKDNDKFSKMIKAKFCVKHED